MKFTFVKMQSVGNDYIYIDTLQENNARFVHNKTPAEWVVFVRAVCDRHTGIGGDGVVLITPTEVGDCGMRMYNADGSEGGMCGNAIRCVAHYFGDTYTRSTKCFINTATGCKKVDYNNNRYTVDMGEVRQFECLSLVYAGQTYDACLVDVGNPHIVLFDEQMDLLSFGRWCQTRWKDGINVQLVRRWQDGLRLDIFERGTGPTLGCGTGACAAAWAAVRTHRLVADAPVVVVMPGGEVTVDIRDNTLRLTGDARVVYRGSMNYV